jgi:hypothetical protein
MRFGGSSPATATAASGQKSSGATLTSPRGRAGAALDLASPAMTASSAANGLFAAVAAVSNSARGRKRAASSNWGDAEALAASTLGNSFGSAGRSATRRTQKPAQAIELEPVDDDELTEPEDNESVRQPASSSFPRQPAIAAAAANAANAANALLNRRSALSTAVPISPRAHSGAAPLASPSANLTFLAASPASASAGLSAVSRIGNSAVSSPSAFISTNGAGLSLARRMTSAEAAALLPAIETTAQLLCAAAPNPAASSTWTAPRLRAVLGFSRWSPPPTASSSVRFVSFYF